jgi:hypothetical protein
MRASEFVREEREEWMHMDSPAIAQARKEMSLPKYSGPASTFSMTAPVAPKKSPYTLGPDSSFAPPADPKNLLRNPLVAKELGFPQDWTENNPTRLTRKMIDPATGNIQLGPDVVVQPGTEEYAQLRRRTNPMTGRLHLTPNARIPTGPSVPPSREHEQRSQREIPVRTRDQGKKMPDPAHPMDNKYQMIDFRREKYRT